MTRPVAAALSIAGLASACATVIGLDGYTDAATAVCACPDLEGIDACAETATDRLAVLTDEKRAAWLSSYDAKRCGARCDHAAECFSDALACEGKRPGCDCCAWGVGALACHTGACAECRTCEEIITDPTGEGFDCVTSRALFNKVKVCACDACKGPCDATCTKTNSISEACRACLSTTPCSDALAACDADKR